MYQHNVVIWFWIVGSHATLNHQLLSLSCVSFTLTCFLSSSLSQHREIKLDNNRHLTTKDETELSRKKKMWYERKITRLMWDLLDAHTWCELITVELGTIQQSLLDAHTCFKWCGLIIWSLPLCNTSRVRQNLWLPTSGIFQWLPAYKKIAWFSQVFYMFRSMNLFATCFSLNQLEILKSQTLILF